MGKLKNKKAPKSHLSEDQKKLGKNHIAILVGMIIVGVAVGIYYMQ